MPSNPNSEVSDRQVRHALAAYGVSVDEEQIAKIREYIGILLRWNRSVSLTTITDPVEIAGRHFGESIFAASLLPVENRRLADIGTGAGFPGLALKIAYPSIRLILIESNKKKCAFLSEVVESIGIQGAEIRAERFEEIRPESIQADVMTCRAVGEFKQLLRWSASALAPRGHLVLWVGAEDSTRISTNPAWTWQPAVRIPESQRRFMLVGRPVKKLQLLE